MTQDYHRLADGTRIPISEMSDNHLLTVVKNLERRALDGMTIRSGGGGWHPDDFWYDEDTIVGREVLDLTNYFAYRQELDRRIGAIPEDTTERAAHRCPYCFTSLH